jgi:hypothetical protein
MRMSGLPPGPLHFTTKGNLMITIKSAVFACLFAPLLVVGCDAPDAEVASDAQVAAEVDADADVDLQAAVTPDAAPCFCPQVYMPVCGVDGQTYGNACMAGCAGVKVAYKGECEENLCKSNGDCASKGEYCQQDGACGDAGTCEPRPQACLQVYDPVCGCDGKTYGNACTAHSAGVSVASDGPCSKGCTSNAQCAKTEFCEQDGVCGGVGTCTARPDACLDVYDPVCGCDGNAYGNGCYAHSAGMSIAGDDTCGIAVDK